MSMEIGIDSFAALQSKPRTGQSMSAANRMNHLIEEIVTADEAGVDVFGLGEHHRSDFLDSAPAIILAAASRLTRSIKLTSAVTVLSAADPVRVFQEFATLDLLTRGRVEIIVGRGSFIESYPLFGLRLEDYDALFTEKLGLLLKLNEDPNPRWTGRFRAELTGQGVYPRPHQERLLYGLAWVEPQNRFNEQEGSDSPSWSPSSVDRRGTSAGLSTSTARAGGKRASATIN